MPRAGTAKSFRDNPGYVANLLPGSLSFIDPPDAGALAHFSQSVYGNSPFRTPPSGSTPAPFAFGKACPIQYVFYIIKENRTYDSILGDIREGNGDPQYCLFPERVTPNHHAWRASSSCSTISITTPKSARTAITGSPAPTPRTTSRSSGRQCTEARGSAPVWICTTIRWPIPPPDSCGISVRDAGITYRSYGEGARMRFAAPGKCAPQRRRSKGTSTPRITAPTASSRCPTAAALSCGEQEFREFERSGKMPRFTVMSLPGDHLLGTKAGMQTPTAMMAENDLVLGRIIDTLSHSRYWKQMAVFVVEDDTQDGPDHVDVHRAPVFLASPYARRGRGRQQDVLVVERTAHDGIDPRPATDDAIR